MPSGSVSFSYEYHCREAARWSGYTYSAFCKLSTEEQAAVIAHYEIAHKLEYLMTRDAQKKKS
jgi:hypothetical protein